MPVNLTSLQKTGHKKLYADVTENGNKKDGVKGMLLDENNDIIN